MKLTSGCITFHPPGEECTDDQDVTLVDWQELLEHIMASLIEDEDFMSISTSLEEISKSLALIAHYLRVIP